MVDNQPSLDGSQCQQFENDSPSERKIRVSEMRACVSILSARDAEMDGWVLVQPCVRKQLWAAVSGMNATDESQFCNLLAVYFWTGSLISGHLSFLVYEMGLVTVKLLWKFNKIMCIKSLWQCMAYSKCFIKMIMLYQGWFSKGEIFVPLGTFGSV